ncbi:MAG: nucleotidyl transferase AbiEii/AbiGii toxin family protein [Chitinophagaceae bacterium]|nr:nucleotidyl transferase AbiEii/AbiGii toxin family protein [Chitinophagaceae bacterium]
MKMKELSSFDLVGGTNLSLRYGHRKSIDLDLFSHEPFENLAIRTALEAEFKDITFKSQLNNKVGLFCFIQQIKVDFIQYHFHPVIDQKIEVDGIRMYGDLDILAMKIFAIAQRGVKKDFWDLALLFETYNLETAIEAYSKKFPSNQMLISIPHLLTYFDDAEESEEPVRLSNDTWDTVKQKISKRVEEYLR